MMKDLTLGYSPCPNDTFIFYALVHKKTDAHGIRFREFLEDVETLNQMAGEGRLDITKVSFHAFGYLRESYRLLNSGGALGKGCGPLVVARTECTMNALKGKKIAIPGTLTTAYLLLQLYDPCFKENAITMPFSEIMSSVKNGEVDAGLVIHEGRFTYHDYGLKEVMDLGTWWEQDTGLPIPLGGIIVKKTIEEKVIPSIEGSIKDSVRYAFHHRKETMDYIKKFAQELSDDVIERHIHLYVNDFTLDIGDEGMKAVGTLFEKAHEKGIF